MHEPEIVDYAKWEAEFGRLAAAYHSAAPFPSIVLDNFLDPEWLRRVVAEFPAPAAAEWTHYAHVNERKEAQTNRLRIPATPLRVIDELNSARFVRLLSGLTGIAGLRPDPQLEGGGLHQVRPGGFLNIHADFTSHPFQKKWARRVNVLIYLNEGWVEPWGGALELWDTKAQACVRKILPVFNRCVIFNTDPDSFHGHPQPLACPGDMTRKSLALYYFTESATSPYTRSTEYRARPGDGAVRRALIFSDKMALRGFDYLKRRLGITNETAGKVLRLFSR